MSTLSGITVLTLATVFAGASFGQTMAASPGGGGTTCAQFTQMSQADQDSMVSQMGGSADKSLTSSSLASSKGGDSNSGASSGGGNGGASASSTGSTPAGPNVTSAQILSACATSPTGTVNSVMQPAGSNNSNTNSNGEGVTGTTNGTPTSGGPNNGGGGGNNGNGGGNGQGNGG